jgi:uncharacterized protein (TIGR02246 family)
LLLAVIGPTVEVSSREERTMSERTQTTNVEHAPTSRRGFAGWVVAVVALIAAGLGVGIGYLVSSQTSEVGQSSVSAQEVDRVVAMLDAYEAAWNANDADAVLDLFTDDYVWADGYTVEASRSVLRREVARWADTRAQWEYVGDPAVVRIPLNREADGTYDVSALWVQSNATTEETYYGITVYRLADDDGVLKIRRSAPDGIWFQY